MKLIILLWVFFGAVSLSAAPAGQNKPERSVPPLEAIKAALAGKALLELGTDVSARQAIVKFAEAAQICHRASDVRCESSMLTIIAGIHLSLSENDKAQDIVNQTMPLIKEAGDRTVLAAFWLLTGDVQSAQGRKQEAVKSYNEALSIFRGLRDELGEAKALNNLGVVRLDLGDSDKALELHTKALEISTRLKDDERATREDPEGLARGLVNIGLAYFALSDFQKALNAFFQCVKELKRISDPKTEGIVLNSIGLTYYGIGDNVKALDYLNQALLLAQRIGYKRLQANILINIASINKASNENSKAMACYTNALSIARETRDQTAEARALNNLGNLFGLAGDVEKALDHLYQALELLRSLADKNGEASSLSSIGTLKALQGHQNEAEVFQQRALALANLTGNLYLQATTLKELASVERDLHKFDGAKRLIEQAMTLMESLRGRYTNEDLQTRFFASAQDYYTFHIDLLMHRHQQFPFAGYDGTALETSERARARALLDLLVQAGADIRQGVEPKLLEQERSLQNVINAKSTARMRLLKGPYEPQQAVAASKELESLVAELQQVEAGIRATSPRYSALTQPQALSLKGIQEQLDNDTLLLEYSLANEHSYGWLVSRSELKSFELPPPSRRRGDREALLRNASGRA